MWKKDRTELIKQRERLLRLQDRIQSELFGVNSALKSVPFPEKSANFQWTEATERGKEALNLHIQACNSAKERTEMMSLGLTPHYCCRGKYAGKRLVYGVKSS